MIKSKEIDKYIHEILIKPYSNELSESDLEKVKNIVLSKYNIKNEIVEYDYSDLSQLINLEKCSIEFLDITDELVEQLNTLENLKIIEINSCNLKTTLKIKDKLKKMILTNSDDSILALFEHTAIDTIEIMNFKTIDLNNLTHFIALKNLYIYNSNIRNFAQILNMSSVEVLKLDGSKIDDDEVLSKIGKNVSVQMREEFLLADVKE